MANPTTNLNITLPVPGAEASRGKWGETVNDAFQSFDDAIVAKTGGTFTGAVTIPSPVLNTGVSGTAVLDEDNMASDSATQLATQQSIKAYVDARILTEDTIAELNDTTISSASDGHFLVHTGSAWVDEAPATALASLGVTATASTLNKAATTGKSIAMSIVFGS